MHEIHDERLKYVTRRALFKQVGYGMGALALGSMLTEGAWASPLDNPTGLEGPLGPHFSPRAKRIIYLFMAGAPSQVDLFDPKPKLVEFNGQPIPEEFTKGERFAFIKGTPKLLGSPFKFEQVGQSGQWVSELLPHFKEIADDVCVIRSIRTTQFNHAPGQLFMNTGFQIPGRPSMGSWLSYGLGTENADLPGFVVLISGQNNPDGGKSLWSNGFLPSRHQGVEFRSRGEAVLFTRDPDGVDRDVRRGMLDSLKELNTLRMGDVNDPEIAARISQYELAYRMQSSVPDLLDIGQESAETKAMYGVEPGQVSFANNCLLARRLVERGVRFVQLYHRGWDHHGTGTGDDITHGLPTLTKQTDQAAAALIKDLKQRGLLDETLVVWGGEFGRTPMNEGRNASPYAGRDHHPHAFTMWVAGGGIRPGSFGATDELGYAATEDAIDVHDLHATLLHQMGIDHTRLTYKSQGRNFRLTDVSGNVVQKLIA